MPDRIVKLREAATRLGVHPKSLALACRNGTSPVKGIKRGDGRNAEWVFSDNEISEHIASLFVDEAVGQ